MRRRFIPKSSNLYKVRSKQNTNSSASTNLSQTIAAIKDVILVVVGGTLGIFGNQFFFETNKRLEARIQLENDFIKEQLPTLNRIVNFTYSYNIIKTSSKIKKVFKVKIGRHFDEGWKFLESGTSQYIKEDTVVIIMPDFAKRNSVRKEFLDDIEQIRLNKNRIDPGVYNKFRIFVNFIEDNPLPKHEGFDELRFSIWNNLETHKKFDSLQTVLYQAALFKLNNPYLPYDSTFLR